MTVITLKQTCSAYPEQYLAKIGSHTIGYIRLRWGHLTCDYLIGKSLLSMDNIRVYEYTFEEEPYKGCFSTEEEREYYLSKCKEALLEKHKELKDYQ